MRPVRAQDRWRRPCRELTKYEGILGGSSTGAAFAAVKKLIDSGANGNIVFISPDRSDRYFSKDMQKDRIVNKISSVKLNEENKNEPVVLENINKIEIHTDNSDEIIVIEGGYLELGLIDTMKDLFVNFIGAVVYSILGYLYIKNRDDYKFAERFIPKLKKKNE